MRRDTNHSLPAGFTRIISWHTHIVLCIISIALTIAANHYLERAYAISPAINRILNGRDTRPIYHLPSHNFEIGESFSYARGVA